VGLTVGRHAGTFSGIGAGMLRCWCVTTMTTTMTTRTTTTYNNNKNNTQIMNNNNKAKDSQIKAKS